MPIKMYCIFARETLADFKKCEGKLGAQAGHAFLHAWWDAEDRFGYVSEGIQICPSDETENINLDAQRYRNTMYDYKYGDDARKIVLVCDTIAEMESLYHYYKAVAGVALTEDCGYTIFDKPTITSLGIGPLSEDQQKALYHLKALDKEL